MGLQPSAFAKAVTLVRHALADAGYNERGLHELLGARDAALLPVEQESLWRHRARGNEARAVFARAFLLGQPVPSSLFTRVCGASAAAFAELGLVKRRAAMVVPTAQIALHGDTLVVSDADVAHGAPPSDHVLPPTTATLLLSRMTMRQRVRRALDLGTGTGLLALRLAAHAETVVGSDVSERALGFARLNAAFAEVPRVRFVASDRFAGLGRARFGLITGNLPFVISPGRRYVYRDAGFPADGFLAAVVSETGRHLEEGGFAQYLGAWAHVDGESEDNRIAPWLARSGCDALVLRLDREPVDRYAARWLAGPAHLGVSARTRLLSTWLRHYERAGIREISTGLWTLRKRVGARHFMTVEDVQGDDVPTGVDFAAQFAAIDAAANGRH